MEKTVALKKCSSYDFFEVYSAVKELFRLAPPPDVRGKTVLIKPNILYPKKAEFCVCTHPALVGAVVKAFSELGAKKVLAGESPAASNSKNAAKITGIYEQVVQNGGEWVEFRKKVLVQNPQGTLAKHFELAAPFSQADIIVSVSKLKSHQLLKYTGAMKNLFGFMVGLEKAQCHFRFPNPNDFGKFLVDLNLAINAQYAIMDAITAMEGPGGPGSGTPINLNFLAASKNVLALDWVCSKLVGYNPHEINYLQEALERGAWLFSEEEIKIVGTNPEEIRTKKFRIVKTNGAFDARIPAILRPLAKLALTKTPHFNAKKCAKCEKCKKICPAHIIEMNGKNDCAKLAIRKKCLHCFCCHEICPAGAITLRRF